jgi:tripartite-type tricarboxylate transporter receptor subunit TctC
MFGDTLSSLAHIKSGALRPLAVTTAQRTAVLADVPTVAETLPGFEASAWFGIGVPKGTPPQIVERLNAEINAGLRDAKISARIAELGATPLTVPTTDYAEFLVSETAKWATAVKAAGVRADQ